MPLRDSVLILLAQNKGFSTFELPCCFSTSVLFLRLLHKLSILMALLSVLSLILFVCYSHITYAKQVYIVLAGERNGGNAEEVLTMHHSMLASVKGSDDEAKDALLYSYKNSFNGFAAELTQEEASTISEMKGVVSVFSSKNRVMHTTRSWSFLEAQNHGNGGLTQSSETMELLWKQAKYGEDIIIGLLDSGIWPESESFRDDGMPPVPDRWKGTCVQGEGFKPSLCNRKIVGARYYLKGYEKYYGRVNESGVPEYRSARDRDGHGTHTASTAAGRAVEAAALGGYGEGKAVGGAPKGRLAMYKVCWPIPHKDPSEENTCTDADMLAALDDAVIDGVDVLSLSIGTTGTPEPYANDAIAVGGLLAVKNGIIVVCSGGNEGPKPSTLSNLAPWLLTVAASSIDRQFLAPLVLGDGTIIKGQTVTPYKLEDKMYPLIFAADAVLTSVDRNNISAGQCLSGSLDPNKVKDKIVLCLRGHGPRVKKGMEVKRAGGVGLLLANLPIHGAEISVDAFVLPGTALIADDGKTVISYIHSTKNPTAKVMSPKTVLGVKPSPFMAAFSSRGPNHLDPNILKPDITAPGLNILAAWSGASSPTKLLSDARRVKYNFMSGTSMSCPHVSGISALIKAIHPDWSPAAIKSAIMTTADTTNNEGKSITGASGEPENPFSYGSGHINPIRAIDPGLVYDATLVDYLVFVCGSGVNASGAFHTNFTCPEHPPKSFQLNYPSIAVSTLRNKEVVHRIVTNVGAESDYSVTVEEPPGVSVKVIPQKLSFAGKGKKRSFRVKLRVKKPLGNGYVFGSLTWSDGSHYVRSPIVVSS